MRRDPALHALGRDHHHMLVHARRLRGLDARIDAATARARFLQYADAVLLHHFAEEESVLLPLAPPDLGQRLRDEHEALRRAVQDLQKSPDDARQRDLGERLRLHVRFEEDVLFEALQQALGPSQLAQVGDQLARHRARARPAAAGDECFL